MSNAMVRRTMNSSYVLISLVLSVRIRTDDRYLSGFPDKYIKFLICFQWIMTEYRFLIMNMKISLPILELKVKRIESQKMRMFRYKSLCVRKRKTSRYFWDFLWNVQQKPKFVLKDRKEIMLIKNNGDQAEINIRYQIRGQL